MKTTPLFLLLSILGAPVLADETTNNEHQHAVDRVDRFGNNYSDTLNHSAESGDGFANTSYQRTVTNKATGQNVERTGSAEMTTNEDGSKQLSVNKTLNGKDGQSIVKSKDYQISRDENGAQVQKSASVVSTAKDGQTRSVSQMQNNQWQKNAEQGRGLSSTTTTTAGNGRSTTLNRSARTTRNASGQLQTTHSRSRTRGGNN